MVWFVLLLVVAPIVEIWFIIQTAQVIGGWQTLALMVAMGFLGAWLIKREGRSVMDRIDQRLKANQLPTKELADGFLLLVAGLLMLTPGFIGDIVGLLLLFPLTRAVARAALLARLTVRMGTGFTFMSASASAFDIGSRRRGGADVVDTTASEAQRPRPGQPVLGPGDPPSGR
jgi:UPF0716 protein FxsA